MSKRLSIIFDDEMFEDLRRLAAYEKITIPALVRKIILCYLELDENKQILAKLAK